MQIKPLRGKILAKLLDEPEKVGSIFVPENNKQNPTRAKVLAVGEPEISKKGREIKPVASIGQVVYLRSKNHGIRVDIEEMKCVFVKNGDIVGKC